MKYKVNDRVRIKSLDWYNENKDNYGYIDCGSRAFFTKMSDWCGKIATIKEICKTNCYRLEEYDFDWTDEMIEGLVEFTHDRLVEVAKDAWDKVDEEMEARYEKIKVHYDGEQWSTVFECPDGYIFKDENGNVINATKIVLEKKKPKYPKTYEECLEIMNDGVTMACLDKCYGYKGPLITKFQKLLFYRDAYWRIAGNEMGLGKSWEPDWEDEHQEKYIIGSWLGTIQCLEENFVSHPLAFPTEEMRDEFYENFKEIINECKELL